MKATCEKCGGKKKSCAHENSTDWGGSKTENGYKLSKQEEELQSSARTKCSSSPDQFHALETEESDTLNATEA